MQEGGTGPLCLQESEKDFQDYQTLTDGWEQEYGAREGPLGFSSGIVRIEECAPECGEIACARCDVSALRHPS